MGTKPPSNKYWLAALLLLLPGDGQTAVIRAASPPATVPMKDEISYKIYWNGIRVGKLWLHWEEDVTHFHGRMQMKTSGLLRIFARQQRTADAEGTKSCKAGECIYTPTRSHWDVDYPHKSRKVDITYDSAGKVASTAVVPPDSRESRPDVPSEDKDRALDPMTATQQLFFSVLAGQEEVKFNTYDGRRFTEYRFDAEDKDKGLYIGARQPLSGYTPKELKDFGKGDPPVYFRMDGKRRFPLEAIAKTDFGRVSVSEDN